MSTALSPIQEPQQDAEEGWDRVYLDAAASTRIVPVVAKRMTEVAGSAAANPSSVHTGGVGASLVIEEARLGIAMRLGCGPEALIFTSCATESNNLALKGLVLADPRPRKHLVVSGVEHPSVLETARWLEASGQAELTVLPVDGSGWVDPEEVARSLRPHTSLVSVMHANNEVGTIQPVEAIARVCREAGVPVHVDACQGFLKAPLDLVGWGIDLVTLSSHKVHGPKGVGALVVRGGLSLTPLLHGGGHESGLRSGTLNAPGIAGFAEAVARYTAEDLSRMRALRQDLVDWLLARPEEVELNGPARGGLCTILNVSISGWTGKELAKALDRRRVLVSASSACHATRLTPSHVLKAMGHTDASADDALRISLGRLTTAADIAALQRALAEILEGSP